MSFCFWVVLKLISSDLKDLSRHHDLLNIASVSVLPPQRTFIFTFLLSSRLFIRPHELMSKVCLLCTEQQRLGDPQADKVGPLLSSSVAQNLDICWSKLWFFVCSSDLFLPDEDEEDHSEGSAASDRVDRNLPVRLQGREDDAEPEGADPPAGQRR